MDPAIITSVISSVATIISPLIATTTNLRLKGSSRKLYEQQLKEVYVPIEKLFIKQKSTKETLAIARQILFDNYLIIPPPILDEFQSVSKLKNIVDSDLLHFKTLIATHYEWTRKTLGYPYNKNRINWSQTPTYRRRKTISAIIWLVWAISLCTSVILYNHIFLGIIRVPRGVELFVLISLEFGLTCLLIIILVYLYKLLHKDIEVLTEESDSLCEEDGGSLESNHQNRQSKDNQGSGEIADVVNQ